MDVLSVVDKSHDKAGLASPFRKALPDVREVPVVALEALTADAFRRDYVDRNLPVVVRGALKSDWKCRPAWDVEYLKETVGHAELLVRTNPSENGTYGSVERLTEGQVSLYDYSKVQFRDFLDQLGTDSPKCYPARVELCNDLPELVPDVPLYCDLPWRFAFGLPYKNGVIAYFGPGLQTTPLHFDTLENLCYMVRGCKTFRLYPPCMSASLSPSPRCIGTLYSLFTPTQAAEVAGSGYDVTLHAGDMLYLPNCWWHTVHGGEGFNISLNYWFCQNAEKEDAAAYRSFLVATFDKTLGQLRSMKLPQSILQQAEKEAALEIEGKINQRAQFSWQDQS